MMMMVMMNPHPGILACIWDAVDSFEYLSEWRIFRVLANA